MCTNANHNCMDGASVTHHCVVGLHWCCDWKVHQWYITYGLYEWRSVYQWDLCLPGWLAGRWMPILWWQSSVSLIKIITCSWLKSIAKIFISPLIPCENVNVNLSAEGQIVWAKGVESQHFHYVVHYIKDVKWVDGGVHVSIKTIIEVHNDDLTLCANANVTLQSNALFIGSCLSTSKEIKEAKNL